MNYMYCEQLLREIRKALYLHPLYISGKCNALQIVLNRDDFFELQAYEMAPLELDDDVITVHYLYGVPVKISLLIRQGKWELVERDRFTESYSGPVGTMFYNCRNCGAPLAVGQSECPYCGTGWSM